MSLYIGTSSTQAVDLIANKDNETLVKQLLKRHYLPAIGSVKLVARPSIPAIPGLSSSGGVYSRDGSPLFAGWVVADGSKYAISSFQEAYQVFGTKYGADSSTFNIPNLLSFYRLNNTYAVQSTAEQPCKAMLSSHQHQISSEVSLSFSGKIESSISCVTTHGHSSAGAICQRDSTTTVNGQVGVEIELSAVAEPGASYADAIPAFHNGSGNYDVFTSPLTINSGADFSLVNTNYSGEENGDCYPAHKTVIPMIYIGADIIGADT